MSTSIPAGSGCPVDHSSSSASVPAGECPVDHTTREAWSKQNPPHSIPHHNLPMEREVSSIPRLDGEKWVYPSQAQFYNAMARKNHNPRQADMGVVVPIHNAVNERAWNEVLKWETGRGGEGCGGIKLVSFKGNPGKMSIKARIKTLFGYQRPFDRHDWLVDRCGLRMRYVIDFYTGRPNSTSPSPAGNLSFYLDVRPALDNWEGVKMRMEMFFNRWILGSTSPRSSSSSVLTDSSAQKPLSPQSE
ncbi:Cytochrome c1 heme lyase [Tulasnella sp. 419]|nr:Cytochrome c1 heme lyase [Tulasnella sp. 419]